MRGVPYLELEDLPALLERLEHYYDAVPRSGARPENFGALTLFVRAGQGWPFSARPALGRRGEVRAADVHRVRLRQRELGVPESFEWVAETAPALQAAVEQAGLFVRACPGDGGALCAGQQQPVGKVSEIAGVGALPAARRRGLGLAVSAALVADARSRGVETVFLSAATRMPPGSTLGSASAPWPPH
ncbi:GNAT family N-acetyltransferase [Streptomyces caniferus]|uniref:GNAT family N-acetyltransferase n=1 Tax=Streptomyces caniferus TaxID=285557 RepID=UPI003722E390